MAIRDLPAIRNLKGFAIAAALIQLDAQVSASAGAWASLSLGANVGNFNTYAGVQTYNNAGVLYSGGVVRLRGLLRFSTAPASGAYIALVPASCRPARQHTFAASTLTSSVVRIDIDTSGNVILYTSGLAAGAIVSLDGLTYTTSNS